MLGVLLAILLSFISSNVCANFLAALRANATPMIFVRFFTQKPKSVIFSLNFSMSSCNPATVELRLAIAVSILPIVVFKLVNVSCITAGLNSLIPFSMFENAPLNCSSIAPFNKLYPRKAPPAPNAKFFKENALRIPSISFASRSSCAARSFFFSTISCSA